VGEWTLPTVGGLLLVYAALSSRLKASPVSQAMVFVTAGLLFGNRALDIVEFNVGVGVIVRHFAEATLALVLFTDAARIDLPRLRREALLPVRLLAVGLPLTIALGTVAGVLVIPGLGFWAAAALATILAPTDAALGEPVVTDSRLPSRIRQGLNVESGLNDGICVPLLIIFLTLAEADEGASDLHPLHVVAEEIGYGVVAGVLAGALAGRVLPWSRARGWMTPTWEQILGIATPLLAYAVAVALGGSGFIAAFVAGIVFRVVARSTADHATSLAEQSGELLNALTFLLFGAVVLGPVLGDLTWQIAVYAVLSLTVVRMVPVALAVLGLGMRGVTVAFVGWFGPRGLASIVFVLLLVEQSGLPESTLMLTVVTLVVALSVLAHGVSAWPGTRWYVAWYDAQRRDDPSLPEGVAVRAPRVRAHPRSSEQVDEPG
jgi:sodium/hydrogen antiporter